MSQDLLYTYVTGFDRNIRDRVEVKGGKLRPYTMQATGDLYREEGVYQLTVGGGLPEKKTNRFGDSPVSELDYSRRRVSRAPYEDGQFMDWADVVRMGTDPRSNKLRAMSRKFERQEDIIIDQAALGTAQGGDNGETSVAFGNGLTDNNIIDVTLGAASGVTNAGFNYAKFLTTIERFGTNDVDLEDGVRPVFKLSYQQWTDMMNDDNFINFDYSGARPIDNANTPTMVRNYMGCDFCFTNIVPYMNTAGTGFRIADSDIDRTNALRGKRGQWKDTDTTKIRACYAMVPEAVLFEVNPDITTEIDKRSDKGFNWYAYLKMDLGAVRMEEEMVVAIPCDQDPS